MNNYANSAIWESDGSSREGCKRKYFTLQRWVKHRCLVKYMKLAHHYVCSTEAYVIIRKSRSHTTLPVFVVYEHMTVTAVNCQRMVNISLRFSSNSEAKINHQNIKKYSQYYKDN